MTLFRLHIRPKGGLHNSKASFDYCLKHSCLGLGWHVDVKNHRKLNWNNYLKLATKKYGKKRMRSAIVLKNNVKHNDLLWTRDENGTYYIARVIRGWQYHNSKQALNADIVNTVRCELLKINNVDDVPGKIVACFRPTRTIQRIKDETSILYSQQLWNDLTKSLRYKISFDNVKLNLYSFLSAEDCEDLVFIYLQTLGWVVVPSSRQRDTMRYEFVLIHRKTHQRAIVQVKTGNTPLNIDDWKNYKEAVYLFQSNNIYSGSSAKNVVCLSPKELKKFVSDNSSLIPANIYRKSKMYASLTRRSS